MKRLFALVLIFVVALSFFAGCAPKDEDNNDTIDLSAIEEEQRLTPHFAGAASITVNIKGNGPVEMKTSGEYKYAAIFFDPEESVLSLRESDVLADMEVGKPHHETQKIYWETK